MRPFVFGARDLRPLCSTGPRVTFGTVSAYPDGTPVRGLQDLPIQMKMLDNGTAGVETDMPELRLPFNAFDPMPRDGDTVLVEGVAYTVNQPTAEDDGAFLCYLLSDQT
jgi:hypothetical protein